MGAEFRLGVQSYCFRKFPSLDGLIDCLKKMELSFVELWPGHQSFEDDPADIRQALDTFARADIRLDAYGVVGLGSDEAKDRRCFELCREAGLRSFSGDARGDALQRVDRLCEEYGVNVALHNHGREHALGRYDQLQAELDRTSPRVGVCLDTAWALDAGEDPLEGVDRFKDRLYGVHLKDFTFDDEGKPRDVIVGSGGLDLPGFLKRLDAVSYSGYLSLEFEGDPEDPLPAVSECVRVIKQAIAGLK